MVDSDHHSDGEKTEQANGDPAEHIPGSARGVLGTSTSELRQFMGRFLVQKLMGR